MNLSNFRPTVIALLTFVTVAVSVAIHAEEEPPAGLKLTAVRVQPGEVVADTLCRLEVDVRNEGSKPADALGFDVLVGGTELKIYESQLFLDPIAAGDSKTIQLFNFWSSESERELPASGDLPVEVRLREAQWVRVGEEVADGASDGATVQTWEPVGAVAGLPVSKKIEVKVKR